MTTSDNIQHPGKKVFYAPDGPGDVIQTYRKWATGETNILGEVSVAYSAQFYDACSNLKAEAYVISPHARKELLQDGPFTVEHRPKPRLASCGGIRFYLGEICYNLGLIRTCLHFRSDVAVVADSAVWPLWAIPKLFGVKIVAVLHCAMWPAGYRPQGGKARVVQWFNGWFWEHAADATLGVSPECIRQVRTIAPRVKTPTEVGLSLFSKQYFDAIPEVASNRVPFRIMFAGRVEENKGVFDLIAMARVLEDESPGAFMWEVCGGGSAEARLRARVQSENLTETVCLRGHLTPAQMAEAYGRCHAVVVPTPSSLFEGFNQVAVEAVLARRPLVTSRVCPAVEFIGPAVVEVPPNDVPAYAAAIRRLADDSSLFHEKCRACRDLTAPFFDLNRSWGRTLQKLLEDIFG